MSEVDTLGLPCSIDLMTNTSYDPELTESRVQVLNNRVHSSLANGSTIEAVFALGSLAGLVQGLVSDADEADALFRNVMLGEINEDPALIRGALDHVLNTYVYTVRNQES